MRAASWPWCRPRAATPRCRFGSIRRSRSRLLLPFDLRPDRVGWTVVETATDRPASLDGMALVGLSLEDAERLVNAFNALEVRCANLARRRVLDDLGVAWLYERQDGPPT
jgi:hypothetical protein